MLENVLHTHNLPIPPKEAIAWSDCVTTHSTHVPNLLEVLRTQSRLNLRNTRRKPFATIQSKIFDSTDVCIGKKVQRFNEFVEKYRLPMALFGIDIITILLRQQKAIEERGIPAEVVQAIALSIPGTLAVSSIFGKVGKSINELVMLQEQDILLEEQPNEREILLGDLGFVLERISEALVLPHEHDGHQLEQAHEDNQIFSLVRDFVQKKMGVSEPVSTTRRIKHCSALQANREIYSRSRAGGHTYPITGEIDVGTNNRHTDIFASAHEIFHSFGIGNEPIVQAAAVKALCDSDNETFRLAGFANWAQMLITTLAKRCDTKIIFDIITNKGLNVQQLSKIMPFLSITLANSKVLDTPRPNVFSQVVGHIKGRVPSDDYFEKQSKSYERYSRVPSLLLNSYKSEIQQKLSCT